MADPWQAKYRRERARRIARLRAELGAEPLVRGGQGRTAGDIHRDTAGVAWCLVCIALLVALLILASCGGAAT